MAIIKQDYGLLGGGGIEPETATFTIAYGTPVTLNFNNPHTEFFAVKSTQSAGGAITPYIMSDGVMQLNSSALRNWCSGGTAGDYGGYEWSSNNKTLTLTMPRNYYGGTYTLIVF